MRAGSEYVGSRNLGKGLTLLGEVDDRAVLQLLPESSKANAGSDGGYRGKAFASKGPTAKWITASDYY